MAFELKSPAFGAGGDIPVKHTRDGPDRSPVLHWSGAPAGTKEFALIVDDPDAPVGTWVHWVLYGVAPAVRELPEGVPARDTVPGVGTQGMNDFRKVGYGGPCPPPGPAHRYFFKLYAIDATLPDLGEAAKPAVERAMDGHIVARTQLMGTYEKKR